MLARAFRGRQAVSSVMPQSEGSQCARGWQRPAMHSSFGGELRARQAQRLGQGLAGRVVVPATLQSRVGGGSIPVAAPRTRADSALFYVNTKRAE